jgi:hypothetical protein
MQSSYPDGLDRVCSIHVHEQRVYHSSTRNPCHRAAARHRTYACEGKSWPATLASVHHPRPSKTHPRRIAPHTKEQKKTNQATTIVAAEGEARAAASWRGDRMPTYQRTYQPYSLNHGLSWSKGTGTTLVAREPRDRLRQHHCSRLENQGGKRLVLSDPTCSS